MKVVILAGGMGSRLSEETHLRPKPMVEIAGQPILWHIMMGYSRHGFSDFIVCAGYRGELIKDYFANFVLRHSDLHVDLAAGSITHGRSEALPGWRVSVVDTGAETQTGGRLKRIAHLLTPGEPFCMTYGDGVSDVDLAALVAFHKAHGLEATLTAVRPPGRFGATVLDGERVTRFEEKPADGWINGGFFVLEPSVLSRINGDDVVWEEAPLSGLAADGQLAARRHEGFWQPLDTLRDKRLLEALCAEGRAPWMTW